MTDHEHTPAGDVADHEAAAPGDIDLTLRTPAERSRTFMGILVNTAAANITTSYLWFALTFWVWKPATSLPRV